MSLYDRIGEATIRSVITEFYRRSFEDVFIGHFFFGKDREYLTKQQIDFTINLLGGPKRYQGKPLQVAHNEFTIRNAHFNRRQVIMREVLTEFAIPKHEIEEWMALEENLRRLIVSVVSACNHTNQVNTAK